MTCIICGDETTDQTCIRCVGRVRRDLAQIENLFALLPAVIHAGYPTNTALGQPHSDELALLGGTALVHATRGTVDAVKPARQTDPNKPPDRSHVSDQWSSDPDSILALLESWVRDWTELRDEPLPTPIATIASEVGYLIRCCGWAGAHHPAFNEFAEEIRSIRNSLEHDTATDPATIYGEHCLKTLPDGTSCGGQLVREYLPPCRRQECKDRGGCTNEEHQGLSDWWVCRRCKRRTDHVGHNLAVHQRLQAAAKAAS